MNLFFWHIPNTLNYGSAMMAENLIYYLNKSLGHHVAIIGDFSSSIDLERMISATGVSSLCKDISIKKRGTARSKVTKAIQFLRYTRDVVTDVTEKDALAVLVLGGDDLSEYYAGKMISLELYQLMQLSRRVSTFLVGQTIGPFNSWRVALAKRSLRNCMIYTRDPLTVDYLTKKLELRKVMESRDLAWLNLPRQGEGNLSRKILDEFCLEEDYITLVPSGLTEHYCDDLDVYISSWLKIIMKLAQIDNSEQRKIVLLAHVLQPERVDDRIVIKSLFDRLDSNLKKRVVPICDVLLPVEARHILGNGLFTITGRMHAAVSTFQMGKPAISLSYSVKYKGVIGEGLGMNDLVIEAKGDDLWKSGKIADLVLEKVDYVFSNYDSLVSRIKPAVEENKKLAMAQIEDIARRLKEKTNK